VASLRVILPIVTDVTVARSVTLVHPAKAVGMNEIPFGRDTRVVLVNIVLDRKGRFRVQNLQFSAMPPIPKVL